MQVCGSAVKRAITCTFLLHSDSNRGPRLTANSSRPKHNPTFTDVILENEEWATWYCVPGEHRGTSWRMSSKRHWKLEMGPIKYHEKSSNGSVLHLFDDRDPKEWKLHRQPETPNNTFAIHFFPNVQWATNEAVVILLKPKHASKDQWKMKIMRLNQKFSPVHARIISSMLKNQLQIPFGRERSVWFISFHWCRTLFICVS